MKRILFISVPELDISFPPAAMAVLKPIASAAGYKMDLFDFNIDLHGKLTHDEWQDLVSYCELAADDLPHELATKIRDHFKTSLDDLVDDATEYLAFSVFSIYSIRMAKMLLEITRTAYPDKKLLCGGNGLSSKIDGMDKDFGLMLLDSGAVDYCIFGEGEQALDSLLRGFPDHPGINRTDQKQISNLDELPFADYDGIDMSRYRGNKLLITGSRGCVRNCSFCDIAKIWDKFRYRSAELLVEEMRKNFYATGITAFEFTDSLINGSTKNFRRFNQLLIAAKEEDPNLRPITYSGQFICKQKSNMEPEIYELMHRAGCSQITVGIESFSEKIRFHMGKKFSDADIEYHLEQCARWGIQNVWLMIVGYPTETIEDHRLTIQRLTEFKNYAKMDIIAYLRWGLTMHIYDDTPISEMLDELGISAGIQNIRDGLYSWSSDKNPSLTLHERIRRRLELHEVSHSLGYKMPNVRSELLSIKALAEGRS